MKQTQKSLFKTYSSDSSTVEEDDSALFKFSSEDEDDSFLFTGLLKSSLLGDILGYLGLYCGAAHQLIFYQSKEITTRS
jgi:hypothetical protein